MITKERVDTLSETYGETRDCVVKAISLAADKPYSEVHEFCAQHGRQNRRGVNFRRSILPHLGQIGVSVEDVSRDYSARTIRTLQREIGAGSFIVKVDGHLLAIRDGEVLDFTEGSCRRVTGIWKVNHTYGG